MAASTGRENFSWPVRVYYEDTDCTGLVYHASYLRFMERARTEWLRHLGYELEDLRRRHGVLFTVSRMTVDYLRPARLGDALEVGLVLGAARRASFLLEQRIRRHGEEPLCRAEVRIACIGAESLRPRAIPKNLLAELERDR